MRRGGFAAEEGQGLTDILKGNLWLPRGGKDGSRKAVRACHSNPGGRVAAVEVVRSGSFSEILESRLRGDSKRISSSITERLNIKYTTYSRMGEKLLEREGQ